MWWKAVLVFCAVAYVAFAKNENYEGSSVFKISAEDLDQVKLINYLEHQLDLDVWSHTLPGRPGQVLVPKQKREEFEDVLSYYGLKFSVPVENVVEEIEREEEILNSKPNNASFPFDTIHRTDVIYEYLEELAAKYPEVMTVKSMGKSFEGRDIKYVKISTTNFEDTSKPIVFIESLIHAREWVTSPVTLYAIQKLVIDVTDSDLVEKIDWIIIPVLNPDGYEYTHEHERYWRKNRASNYESSANCVGVDLNRNFDYDWGVTSSNSVCSDTFHGSKAFSEPETAAVRDLLAKFGNGQRVKLFLDIHSYGSYFLYAYGDGKLPSNALIVHLAGVTMAQAIDKVKWPEHPNYTVGNSALVLYFTSGTTKDYAQKVFIPLAYTVEMPAYKNSGGLSGFQVDPMFIEQAGYETWEGIKAGARFVYNNF